MKKRNFGRRRRRGLTLIDVMVAVTIIAMFSGLIAVVAKQLLDQAQLDAAKVEVKTIADALQLYRMRRRSYPTTGEGLTKLVEEELVERRPTDPWGNDYVYVSPGEKNRKSFDLFSKGPDGVERTDDDIW